MVDAIDLLDPKMNINEKVKLLLKELPSFDSILITIPKEHYKDYSLSLIKNVLEKDKLIYVSLNKKSDELKKELNNEKINSKNINFVDSVTNIIDEEKPDDKKVLYVDSPSDLSNMEDSIDQELKLVKKGFLIFDSLSTLLVYNDEESSEKFVHKVSQKIKEKDFSAIFIIVDSANPRVLSIFSQFFDNVIDLS